MTWGIKTSRKNLAASVKRYVLSDLEDQLLPRQSGGPWVHVSRSIDLIIPQGVVPPTSDQSHMQLVLH